MRAEDEYHYAHVTVDGYEGPGYVVPGHDLDVETVNRIAKAELLADPVVTEVFWLGNRRVKWCDRIDGFGCDSCGEWHRHWSAVKPNDDPGTHFSVIRDQREPGQ